MAEILPNLKDGVEIGLCPFLRFSYLYVSELPVVPKIQVVKVETMKKSSISILKQTFFRSFNFDDLYFWNHWEFRDVMYLILKV